MEIDLSIKEEAARLRDLIPIPVSTCGKIAQQYPEFFNYVVFLEQQVFNNYIIYLEQKVLDKEEYD